MISLTIPKDLEQLDKNKYVHPLIRQYLVNYFNWLLSEYKLTDLQEVGQLFFLQPGESIELLPPSTK